MIRSIQSIVATVLLVGGALAPAAGALATTEDPLAGVLITAHEAVPEDGATGGTHNFIGSVREEPSAEGAARGLNEHLVPETTADVADVAAANVTETAGTLRLESPVAGAWVSSPLNVTFTTSIPSSAGGNYFVEVQPVGGGEWLPLTFTKCASPSVTRTCSLRVPVDLNADYQLRVYYSDDRTCTLQACTGTRGAFMIDTVKPASTAVALPKTSTSIPIGVAYTAADNRELASVELQFRYEDGAWTSYETLAAPAASGAFSFIPTAGPGRYSFRTLATDMAGNAETKTGAEATTDLVLGLTATVTTNLDYVHNGNELLAEACVKRLNGNDVTALDGASVEATFLGATFPLTHVAGCKWTASTSVQGVTEIGESTLSVLATLGSATGNGAKLLTTSPNRLVTLGFTSENNYVEVGEVAKFRVRATYADTGAPARTLAIAVSGWESNLSAVTDTAGVAVFQFVSSEARRVPLAFSAASSVSAESLASGVTWTDLVPTLAVEHESYFNNVGQAFATEYCVAFADDPSVSAENVYIEVVDATDLQLFSAITGADGCADIPLAKNVVGTYAFNTSLTYDVLEATFPTYEVLYTKVQLVTTTSDSFVNIGDSPALTVCGTYAGSDAIPAGAQVRLVSGEEVLESLLVLDETGCATKAHTFGAHFDGPIDAELLSTVEEVSSFVQTGIARQVATEVRATYASSDAFRQPGEAIVYTVELEYATGEPVPVASLVNLTGPRRAADPCVLLLDGAATCALDSAIVYAESFVLAIETADGITRIAEGQDKTPETVWTLAHVDLDAVDTIVNIGDDVVISGAAYYVHGANPAIAEGTLVVLDSNGDQIAQTDVVDGAFSVAITYDTIYQGAVSVELASTDTDVTELDVAAQHAELVWTIVNFVNVTTSDAFANSGDVIAVCAEASFGHGDNAPVPLGTVDIVRDGEVLATATLLDGAFCQDVTFGDVFAGDLELVLTSATHDVTKYSPEPLATPMVWTEIVLTGAVTDSIVNIGDTITLSGTASYAHGPAVPDALFDVMLDDGTVAVANVSITNGTFSTPVTIDQLYDGDLRVIIKSGQDGVVRQVTELPLSVVFTEVVSGLTLGKGGFVALGHGIPVNYTAAYAHGGAPASFQVRVQDGCGFDQIVNGTDGFAPVVITHTDVCSTMVQATLVGTADGITRQSPVGGVSQAAVWTKITLAPSTTDAFATLGQDVTVSGTATYDHGSQPAVQSALVTVTNDEGVVFCTSPVVAGAFSCSAAYATTYVGKLHFVISEGDRGVNLQSPAALDAVWTTVLLTLDENDRFVATGEGIVLAGSATYAGGLGSVSTGSVAIRNATGASLGTAAIVDGRWTATVSSAAVYHDLATIDVTESFGGIESDTLTTPTLTWTKIVLSYVSPDDLFVNTIDSLLFDVSAAYAHGPLVTDATLAATATDGTLLGTCEVADGGCVLELTTEEFASGVYAGVADIRVTRGFTSVTQQAPADLATPELVWTKLLVSYTHDTGPFGLEEASNFEVTIVYAHDTSLPVVDALATIDGFSIGDESDFTDATGRVSIAGIETEAGTRTLTVTAIDTHEGIEVIEVSPSSNVTLRWTALSFTPFTYSVTPIGTDAEDGGPVFRIGTLVNVCTRVNTADNATQFVPGSVLQLRGSTRTASASTAQACYPLKFSTPRDVTMTAHGLSGVIDGKTIYASVDRTIVVHFVS